MTAPAQPTHETADDSAEDDQKRGKTYDVNIEGTIQSWDHPTITSAQIRTLGHLPDDQSVIEIDFKDNSERTLAEGEAVELKPGHGFGKKVGFKRGDR